MKESGSYENNFSELALQRNVLELETKKRLNQKKFKTENNATFYKPQGIITYRFY